MESNVVEVTLAQLRAIKEIVEKRLSRATQIVFPAGSNQDYFVRYNKYLILLREQHPEIFGDMPQRPLPSLEPHFRSEFVIERKHMQQLYDDITEILTIWTSVRQPKSDSYRERFQELIVEAKAVETFRDPTLSNSAIALNRFQRWATSVLNLLSDVFGKDSFHYIEFERYFAMAARSENNSITKSHYSQSLTIFESAKEQFERGSLTAKVTSGVPSGRAAKMASTHRTLNILFLDLAGWSKLSAAQITTYLEKALPKLAAKIGEFRSDHLNTWGDAVVAAFSSATDAANCALDIRDLFRRATETDGVPRGLVPRISLHVGDVIIAHNPLINRNDIFGDAVHLAARLEPVTARGQVFCTEEFAKSLSGLVGTAPVVHAHTEVDLPKGFGRIKVFAVTGPNEEPPVAQTGQ